MTADRWGTPRWIVVGLCLLAWALRLPPLLAQALHPDEALYGYWGLLIGRGHDPWLIDPAVYKPPLLPYLIAVLQLALGRAAYVPRLPGLLAGVAAVALAGALAKALYRDVWTGVGAAAALAVFPFAVAFSGSAFPDALMVTLGLAACAAASRGRGAWTGGLVGASFATKQTGLVWLPAALGILLAQSRNRAKAVRGVLLGFAVPTVMSFAWDGVRVAQGADSFWSAGVVGYGGLRLIWPHELWSRLGTWLRLTASLLGSTVLATVLALGAVALCLEGVTRRPRARDARARDARTRDARTRGAFFDVLLTVFCVSYVCLHWLIAFPTWRRYLLPIVPPAAVLLSRIAQRIASVGGRPPETAVRGGLAALLLTGVLLVPAVRASAGQSPVAEDRAAYAGVEDIAAFFSSLDEGSVVYHHWLGWHYHFALFNGPVYLSYWPTPAWLARDVQAFGFGDPRYIAFPPWESIARVEEALAEVGYALKQVRARPGNGSEAYAAYRIVPRVSQ